MSDENESVVNSESTSPINSSILKTIRKLLGMSDDYKYFDEDIIIHINSAFATLNQLGVGPEEGFEIEDESAIWSDFVNDSRFNSVKSYVFLSVKQIFDPPTSGSLSESINRQLQELTWRLSIVKD